jgi:hypothetical protein
MNVLYLISAYGKGSGGHFNSLNNIAKALDGYKDIDITIASIGNVASPILKTNSKFLGNLEFNWYSFFKLNKKFKDLCKGDKIDLVHCYDGGTALIIMMLPFFWKTRIIHTKCGGPNERHYFAQFLETVILFSKENLISFNKNKRFDTSNIHLIPNRVFRKEIDIKELSKLYQKDDDKFTFLRIARIGKTYEESILQSIQLVEEIQNINPKVKLIIIGVIEDEFIFNEIKKFASVRKLSVEFLTNQEFTSEASRFLYLADVVIGTGRGVMEAMSNSIPVFAPLNGRALPAYVNSETFDTLFFRNFSQRNQIDEITDTMIIEYAVKLSKKDAFYQEMEQFSNQSAVSNFLITNEIKEKYYLIYQNIMQRKRGHLIIKNIIPILYYLNALRNFIAKKFKK